MLKPKSSRLAVAILAVAAVIMVAGGAAIASNMGFKLNKPIVFAGTGQIGNNWTSIPYNNPYGNVGQFCSQTGLTSTGTSRAVVSQLNPSTGLFSNPLCGTSTANATALPLVPGGGARIRQPSQTGAPSNIIIVGSHNPTLVVSVPDTDPSNAQIGNTWFSVPYHTTAVTVNDLCLSAGLTSTGTSRAVVSLLDASTGLFSNPLCGTSTAANTNLVLGNAVRIRDTQGSATTISPPKTFIPAHF
jgi:hypothetical protein